jgi:hypothetical protein
MSYGMDNANTSFILENYARFVSDHNDMVGTPQTAMRMLTEDSAYESYIASLTSNLDEKTRNTVKKVCDRAREDFIIESIVGPSANAIGYNVMSYVILVDIYSNPQLIKMLNTHTINKSMMSIPYNTTEAQIKQVNGSILTQKIPKSTTLIRGASENITLTPSTLNNIYRQSTGYPATINIDAARINNREFMISTITMTGVGGGAEGDTTTVVKVNVRSDARGQLQKTFTFKDSDDVTCVAQLIGNINYDTGDVSFSVVQQSSTDEDAVFTPSTAVARVVFVSRKSNVGRPKIIQRQTLRDINVDIADEFEIELEHEKMQDFRDIWNVNVVKNMSDVIKTQMLLNKDLDIVSILESNEVAMKEFGAYQAMDFAPFYDVAGITSPPDAVSIMRNIIPKLSMVSRTIQKNFGAMPQFIATGSNCAVMLESLQKIAMNMPDINNGTLGYIGDVAQFNKQSIIYTPAMPNDKIYLIYRAPDDNLSTTTLLDIVYKPMYIIDEVTNSLKYTFVKSRTTIEVCRTDALGYVEVDGIDQLVGTV